MALITYADKQAMGTQPSIPDVNKVTDSDMNEIKTAVNSLEAQWCVATITTSPTISSNYYVPLNLISKKNGDFSLQDGGIKIPTGVNHIKVSGNVFINNWPGGTNYLWARIYRTRGTQNGAISGSITGTPSAYLSAPIPSSIIDVQEGDIIKLMADSGSGGTIREYTDNTWLMVEKID